MSQDPNATPAAIAHAVATGVDLSQIEGSGAEGKITKADVAAAAESSGEIAQTPAQALAAPDIHFLQAQRASLQMNRDALTSTPAVEAEVAAIDAAIAAIDEQLGA